MPRPDGEDTEIVAAQSALAPGGLNQLPQPMPSFSPDIHTFHVLFEAALDAIVVADDGGRYVAANSAACELFGLSQGDLLGRTIADFTPADTSFQEVWQEFQQLGADRGEFTLQRADGTLRVVEYAATANFLPHFHLSILRDVTAQKEAEKALHALNQSLGAQVAERTAALAQANQDLQSLNQRLEESQKKYQTLFNVMPVGVSITNAEGDPVEVNSAATDIFQIPVNPEAAPALDKLTPMEVSAIDPALAMTDETGWQVIFPDGRPMDPEDYAATKALRQGQPVLAQEQGIQRPDGTVQWLMVSAAPIPLADYGVALAYLDVTDHKEMEMALRESEERLRMALDAAQMGIWDWNLETNEVLWSENLERLMGMEPGSFDGLLSTVKAMVYPPDQERMRQALRRCIGQGEAYNLDLRFVRANGTVCWATTQGDVVRDAEGKALRLLGTAIDITDRKQAELAIQEKEQEFRTLAENSPDCILRCDPQFRFLYANPATLTLTHRPASDFLGKTAEDLGFPEPIVALWHGAMERALSAGQEQFLEFSLGERSFDERVVPEFGMDGTVTSFLVVVRDITQLKRVQQALMLQAEREHTLRLITQEIRASLDLNDILSTAVQAVHSTLQADRTLIFQLKTDQSAQVIQERVQPPYPSTLGRFQWDENFPSECYASYARGHARIVPDVMVDSWGECLTDYMAEMAVRSKMVAPILHSQDNGENRVWGLLITHACVVQRTWQAEELDLLQQVSDQLAIAIQQAALHQQIQAANRELGRISNTDVLTQIANRRCFDDTLAQVWQQAQRGQQSLTLIMCDVDYFKPYNDTYGHPAGDRCLAAVAQALKRCINRTTDCLARYGGEEFAIILPCTSLSGAITLVQAMQRAIADLNISHSGHLGGSSQVTLSFGLASTVPPPHSHPQFLIDQADQALYQAKEKGRNCLFMAPSPREPAVGPDQD